MPRPLLPHVARDALAMASLVTTRAPQPHLASAAYRDQSVYFSTGADRMYLNAQQGGMGAFIQGW